MKLERLLKVPRSTRSIQLVINIPEPSAPPAFAATTPKPTGWARAWAVLKVAGPATVATAALFISILNLHGQAAANRDLQQSNAAANQANAAAVTARQKQDAEQVSFLQNPLPQPPYTSLLVENHASTPIYNITFQVEAIIFVGQAVLNDSAKNYLNTLVGGSDYLVKSFTLWLGNMPACSSDTVNVVPATTGALLKETELAAAQIGSNPVAVVVESMSFGDSSGVAWQYSDLGGLQQLDHLPAKTYTPDGYLQGDYRDAAGCA